MPRKIMLAVPTYETICTETYEAINEIVGNPPDETDIFFRPVTGYGVAQARNHLVDLAIDTKADYIFFVDNDVVPEPSSLSLLLSGDDPVVLGYYARRPKKSSWQGATSLFKNGERDFTKTFSADEIREFRENGIYRIDVHGGGMGCALIKMDIFKNKIDYPWFRWTCYPGKIRRALSEDFYFCRACHRAGIPIVADTRVACGHVIRYVQYPDPHD